MSQDAVLGFECEWFDEISNQLHKLFLKFYLSNATLEIQGTQRTMLARIFYPSVTAADLFVGNSITVYNRVITIISYANAGTTRYMSEREIHVCCVVHQEASQSVGTILTMAKDFNLVMGKIRTISRDMPEITGFKGDFVIELIGYSGKASVEPFLKAVSKFGDGISTSEMPATEMLSFFRGKFPVYVDDEAPVTLCLIKPHVMRAKKVGEVLDTIVSKGYTIQGVHSAHMTNTVAEELFDSYREIYPKYTSMIEQLTDAPCLAVMVTHDAFDLVETFREFTGPLNPELAVTLRPNSLRAKFGTSWVQNAVHCTDLAEDAHMECRYFFETLAGL
jgi:nucleoside-diphosphate kinase